MYVGTSRSSRLKGRDYYLGYFENAGGANAASILLITSEIQPVSYSVEVPGIQYNLSCGTFTVNNETIINLPDNVIVRSQNEQNKGIHASIQTDRATVIGQNVHSENSDTFLVLPVTNATNNTEGFVYYGMSVAASAPIFDSMILIVGTEDNTKINITTKTTEDITVGDDTNCRNISATEYYCVINRLQTLLITLSQGDLTGTKIIANNEVSVFSGHQAGSVVDDTDSHDHLIEQIPSIDFWGREYYTSPLASRIVYSIKILAAYNFTSVVIYCNGSLRAEPLYINEGDFIDETFHHQEYCAIYSNNSILVVQFSHTEGNHGGALMALVPAATHYLNKLDFSTIRHTSNDYSHYINIIVMEQYYQPDMIYLISGGNNVSLQSRNLSPVPIFVNGSHKAFAIQDSVSEGVIQVVHANANALITAISYGFANHAGYGHPAGLKLIG